MIATLDGTVLMRFDTTDRVPTASWMRPAALPDLAEWAAVEAGIWLAEVLDWRPEINVSEDAKRLLLRPQDWHLNAVCATSDPRRVVDPYWFGRDDTDGPALPPEHVAYAREHCSVCPVRVDCLAWALEHDERFGIWGGTTGRQRHTIRRGLAAGTVTLSEVFAQL